MSPHGIAGLSPEPKRSRDVEHFSSQSTMYALILDINLPTNFEAPSFTHTKDMTGAQELKNGSRDPDHSHLGVRPRPICHSYRLILIRPTVQN